MQTHPTRHAISAGSFIRSHLYSLVFSQLYGLRMSYRVPLGTEIIPYASASGQTGWARLTSILVTFEQSDVLETCILAHPSSDTPTAFYRLSLGDNPSIFDSYLVAVDAVEQTDANSAT